MHLYEQIYEDLKRAVDEGEIRPGERLPSIRDLAAQYGCNKLTVQRAFDRLAETGLAENLVGSGSFVAYPKAIPERSGDFSAARLSEDFFPYDEASRLLAEVLAAEKGRVFSAAPAKGEPGLLAALALRFALPAESLLVTGGGLQALDLCRRLFAGRDGPGAGGREEAGIIVEEPCFPSALSLFHPATVLPFGPEGPDPGDFGRALAAMKGKGPRLFYAVPDIHNPTGLRYSEERKRAIADLARKEEAFIVEDDYLSELEPSGIPRFVDLLPERTIWIKSLSKTTAPGIRIGAISAPPSLLPRLESLKAEVEPGPAAWLQLFAERVVSSGLLDAELERTTRVMRSRRAELLGLLSRWPGLSVEPGSAGYNLWVESSAEPRLPSPPWAEGRRFGFAPALRRSFRLSFMALGEAEWPQALRRLELCLSSSFGQPAAKAEGGRP
jgi:DNA-binding transcriptional MocR family regulator